MTSSTKASGRIMWTLLNDLKNKASGETEIADAMRERGWNYGHSTMAPELAKLVSNGDLVKSDGWPATYRLPGNLKIKVREG